MASLGSRLIVAKLDIVRFSNDEHLSNWVKLIYPNNSLTTSAMNDRIFCNLLQYSKKVLVIIGSH